MLQECVNGEVTFRFNNRKLPGFLENLFGDIEIEKRM
jgi:hypothetical protein